MTRQTLQTLSTLIAQRKVSATELVQDYLAHIEKLNPLINAFITVDREGALKRAALADIQIAAGCTTPLTGLPIAHKDLFCTEGVLTSCGSKMLANFTAPYDAHVVEKLKEAGTVSLGKTNCDEFAMGSTNENAYFGAVKNPWNIHCVPGGSSGGSAAAVAAGMIPACTGTDTGGSIRQPASFCGITGIKPTYGVVSRYGMVAYASSLDQGGPMAHTAEDCALLLNAMAGFDARDSTSLERPAENYSCHLNTPLQGLRIGLPKEYFGEGLASDVRTAIDAALDELRKLGASTVEVSLPNTKLAIPAYYVIAPAEASSNLSRYDGVRYGHRTADYGDLEEMYKKSRSEGFSDEVKRRILVGTYVLSHGYYDAYYIKAQQLRRLIAQDFQQALQHCDVIAGPVAPTTAWTIGKMADDPVQMYLCDIYTIAVNLAGLPALSAPCGFGLGNMPIGLQLIGDYFTEAKLLGIAHQYQCVTDWHTKEPVIKI